MSTIPVLRARAKKQNDKVRIERSVFKAHPTNKNAVRFGRAMTARDKTVRSLALHARKR